MPVVMWGASFDELERLRDIGFTHFIGLAADFNRIWEAGNADIALRSREVASDIGKMDEALEAGLDVVATLSPGSWARSKKEFCALVRTASPTRIVMTSAANSRNCANSATTSAFLSRRHTGPIRPSARR